jgi:hypothetical protein
MGALGGDIVRPSNAIAATLISVSVFVAQLASAHAQTYVSLVYGGVQCDAWSSRKQIEARAYEAWIFGYISAYNAYVFKGPNVIEGLELVDLRSWIDGYCKQNPQETLDSVARSLVAEYTKKN